MKAKIKQTKNEMASEETENLIALFKYLAIGILLVFTIFLIINSFIATIPNLPDYVSYISTIAAGIFATFWITKFKKITKLLEN